MTGALRACVAGLAASRVAPTLGRTTVNRYRRLFRTAIAARQHGPARAALCTGTVEVDESHFGPTWPCGVTGRLKPGRGTPKQPVFGVFERGGRVFTGIVPDTDKPTFQRLVRGKIALEATVVSNGWRGCDGLVDVGYDRHLRIRKARPKTCKARPKTCSKNGIHGPRDRETVRWGLLKKPDVSGSLG